MKTKIIMLALLAMQSACSGGSGADVIANDGTAPTSKESAKTDLGSGNAAPNTGKVSALHELLGQFTDG
jgi:hypothetical protein